MLYVGGVYDAEVAPDIAVPPVLVALVFEYHWYETVPVPPDIVTDNGFIVAPTQTVWLGVGWVAMEGGGTTVMVAI